MAAKNLKHVAQLKNTQRRVIVVFREIPDEPSSCLVVDTDALPDWMHNDVINAVESPGAQSAANFYEYAQRAVFTDGSNMLQTLHTAGRLMKQPTNNVVMTPNSSDRLALNELNDILREQTGGEPVVTDTSAQDEMPMANKTINESTTATPQSELMNDAELAKNMIAQAEQFEAEAKNLREQAYEMDPDLKPKRGRPPKAKTEEAVAE